MQLLLDVLDFYNRLTTAERLYASKSLDLDWQRRLICIFFLRGDGHHGAFMTISSPQHLADGVANETPTEITAR